MSVKEVDLVMRCSKSKSSARTVLLLIADRVHERKGIAWPSVSWLAERANITERQVHRNLVSLVKLGELEILPKTGCVNHYRIPLAEASTPDTHVPDSEMSPLTPTSQTPDTHVMSPLTPTSQTPDTHVTQTRRTRYEPEEPEGECARTSSLTPPETESDELNPKTESRKRASRLLENWTPSVELQVWARREYPNLDAWMETAKFRDYWLSKSGSGATKLDWDATWRNWIRKAAEWAHPRAAPERKLTPAEYGLKRASELENQSEPATRLELIA